MISIIMPSYNQAQFIGAAIDSVFRQATTQEVELIVFDGGSGDDTLDVLKAKSAEYPGLLWVSEPDTGPANALNKALAKTRGTIIGWLNSDDLYADNAFKTALAYFQAHPEAIMVYGQGEHIDAQGAPLGPYPTQTPDAGFDAFRNGCFICQPTVFFKRSLYNLQGPLDESYKAAFDYEYWMRAFQNFQGRIGFIDQVLAKSRLHEDCITQTQRSLVASDGARASAQYFGMAPIHWLTTYLEDMQKQMGQAEFELQSNALIAFARTLEPCFDPEDYERVISSLS